MCTSLAVCGVGRSNRQRLRLIWHVAKHQQASTGASERE
jgi:hypothetical protein